MEEVTLKKVEKVLEKLVEETPVEKVLLMDTAGQLVRSHPVEAGDADLAKLSFGMVRNCTTTSRGLGMGDLTKLELASKGSSLLIVGVDRKYLVTLKARGKIDDYLMLSYVIQLFHEYDLGTRVSKLAMTALAPQ